MPTETAEDRRTCKIVAGEIPGHLALDHRPGSWRPGVNPARSDDVLVVPRDHRAERRRVPLRPTRKALGRVVAAAAEVGRP